MKKRFVMCSLLICSLSLSNVIASSFHIMAAVRTDLAKEYSTNELLINSSQQPIYLFKEASLKGDVIAMLEEGGSAYVLDEYNNCYYAISGDYKGYIAKNSVLHGKEALENEEKYCQKQATVTTDTAFLYQEPSCSNSILSIYSKGTVLELVEAYSDSISVMDSTGLQGYLSKDCVTIDYVYIYAIEPDIDLYCELYPESALATYDDTQDYDAIQETLTFSEDSKYVYVNDSDLSLGQQVCDYAAQFIGNPYVWGGTSLTDGADCSGFIQSLYNHFNISLPRTSTEMRNYGYRVCEGLDLSLMQPGDVICYDGHVSLYIGNEEVISAASPELGIIKTSVHNRTDYISVQRFVSGSQTRTISLSNSDKDILNRIVEAEAGNQCFLGKVYVANVIINRLLDTGFGDSIEEIVFSYKQFSPVTDGRYYTVNLSNETRYAVDYAISHADNSKGALYFMNPNTADNCNKEWFNKSLKHLFTFKNHAFYK